ncbi:MAG: VOC family protein [Planctomycetota bacterium]
MQSRISPFLMFQDGNAEAAMNFYISVFPDSEILSVEHYPVGAAEPAGSIQHAVFKLMGQQIKCSNSPPVHDFDFTPSMSLYVECSDETQLDGFAEQLADGGEFLMPPGSYGFSQKFAFLKDRYGVSWQLNLP